MLTKEEIEKLIEEKVKSLHSFYSTEELVTKKEFGKLLENFSHRFEIADRRFEELIKSMNERFEAVDCRFEELIKSMNERFEAVDRRFEAADRRFEELIKSMNERFQDVQRSFDKVFVRLDEISSAFGHDFEEFNSYWLQTFLVEQGYPNIEIRKRTFFDENYEVFPNNKDVEVDLFNEDPLVIGEVTAIVRSIEKVTTFIRKIRFLEKKLEKTKYRLFICYSIIPEIREEAIRLLEDEEVKVIILRR